MVPSILVGQKLPDFQLPDQNGATWASKDFLGKKTVLAFFPGAFTETCTKEMCAFRDSMKSLIDFGAQVIGITVNDPFTNKAFAEANGLHFPILSDYTRATIRKYGVFHENFAGLMGYTVAKRSVFIQDKNGILRYKWISEDPSKEPNYQEIIGQLGELLVM